MATKRERPRRASLEPALENASLFVTFTCIVEFFSHVEKCARVAVCQPPGQEPLGELAHSHVRANLLLQFVNYPCQASSLTQFLYLVKQPLRVLSFHLHAPLAEAPRLLAPSLAFIFAAFWALRHWHGGAKRNVLILYLVLLALNDTILPAALLFVAPHRLTTHAFHILPDLYAGPPIAAFVWLPLDFVAFYSAITVLGAALSYLALGQIPAADPLQLRLLVRQCIVAGVLSVLYAASRGRIWAAASSALSRAHQRPHGARRRVPPAEPQKTALPAPQRPRRSAAAEHFPGTVVGTSGTAIVSPSASPARALASALPIHGGTDRRQPLVAVTAEHLQGRRRQCGGLAEVHGSLEPSVGHAREEPDASPPAFDSLVKPQDHHRGSGGGDGGDDGCGSSGSSGAASVSGCISAGGGCDSGACGAQPFSAAGGQRRVRRDCGPGCRSGPGCRCCCSRSRDCCWHAECCCCCCQAACVNCATGHAAAAASPGLNPSRPFAPVPHAVPGGSPAAAAAQPQPQPQALGCGTGILAYEGFWSGGHGSYDPLFGIGSGLPGSAAYTRVAPALQQTGVAAAGPSASSRASPDPAGGDTIRAGTAAIGGAAVQVTDLAATAPPSPLQMAVAPGAGVCPSWPGNPGPMAAAESAAVAGTSSGGAAPVSPLEHARALTAAAALCTYQGSMALRRVVIRVPAPWAAGLPAGWSEGLREELHKRHPDWSLLSASMRRGAEHDLGIASVSSWGSSCRNRSAGDTGSSGGGSGGSGCNSRCGSSGGDHGSGNNNDSSGRGSGGSGSGGGRGRGLGVGNGGGRAFAVGPQADSTEGSRNEGRDEARPGAADPTSTGSLAAGARQQQQERL